MLREGYRIGDRYEVVRLLSSGGQGEVWEAKDLRAHGRRVAIKFLRLFGTGEERTKQRQRFHDEALALSRISDSHVVILRDTGEWEDLVYHVLELAQGDRLRDWLRDHRRADLATIRALFDGLCQGIAAGHRLPVADHGPIVHRDIGPENVMVAPGPGGALHATVIDYGLARLGTDNHTATTWAGKKHYWAPEQTLSRGEISPRTDVFALAVVLVEMLTGSQGYGHGDEEKCWWAAVQQGVAADAIRTFLQAARNDVPERVWDTVVKALHPRQEERFANADELLMELRNVAWDSDTIVVALDGSGDEQNLQSAIDRAQPGWRVVVRPGKYALAQPLLVDKAITLLGHGPREDVIIEGIGSCFSLGGRAALRGLSLIGRGWPLATVEILEGTPVVEDCEIQHIDEGVALAARGKGRAATVRRCLLSGGTMGLLFADDSTGLVERCVIRKTSIGMGITQGADPVVRGCLIEDCSAVGVVIRDKAKGSVLGCRIERTAAQGIRVQSGAAPRLCVVAVLGSGGPGIEVSEGATATLERCNVGASAKEGIKAKGEGATMTLSRCKVHHCKEHGITFEHGAGGTLEEGDVYANGMSGIEIVFPGAPVTIRRTKVHHHTLRGIWIHACAEALLEACEVSANGDGLVVLSKTTELTVRRCVIHHNTGFGISVRSGGSGTFEDCEVIGNTLSGLEARDAGTNPTVRRAKIHDGKSTGIYVRDGASGMFEDCEVFENTYSGMEVGGSGTSPFVRRGKMHHGKSAGIFVHTAAGGTFDDCDVYVNTSSGIAVKDPGTNPFVRGGEMHHGKSAGIYVYAGAGGTFEGCDVFENTLSGIEVRDRGTNPTVCGGKIHHGKQSGLRICEGAGGTFEDCDVFENANAGIVVKDEGTSPTVRGGKIHHGKSVGIYVYAGARGTFEDCDVFENAFAGIDVRARGTNPTVRRGEVHHGRSVGIFVHDGASGTFEDCDVYENNHSNINVGDRGTNPTVRRGKFHHGKSAGIFVYAGGGGAFEDCEVFENALSGIDIRDAGTNPMVVGGVFRFGDSHGVRVSDGASGTFKDSRIFSNVNWGITLEGMGSSIVIQGATIHHGKSGGVRVEAGARATLERCELFGHLVQELDVSGEATVTTSTLRDGIAGALVRPRGKLVLIDSQIHGMAGYALDLEGDARAIVLGGSIEGAISPSSSQALWWLLGLAAVSVTVGIVSSAHMVIILGCVIFVFLVVALFVQHQKKVAGLRGAPRTLPAPAPPAALPAADKLPDPPKPGVDSATASKPATVERPDT